MSSNGPEDSDQLKHANDDAKRIADVLSKEEYGFEIFKVPGEISSSKYHILAHLSQIIAGCTDQDDFIFYFSGHGDSQYSKLHLILDKTTFQTKEDYLRTSLPIAGILEEISNCQAKNILIILDCCHAGAVAVGGKSKGNNAFGEDSSTPEFETIIDNSESYQILLASGKLEKTREIQFQLANESEPLRGGFLTIYLYRALTEKPKEVFDNEKYISISQVNEWLKTETEEFNKNNSNTKPIPIPFITNSQVKGKPFRFNKNKKTIPQSKTFPESIVFLNQKSPYIGLKPFSMDDEAIFYGRQSVVDTLEKKVQDSRFVFLVGASGSGKSSIVQAGLAPRLKRANWRVLNPIKPLSSWNSPSDNLKLHLVKELCVDRSDSIETLTKNLKSEGLGVASQWVPEGQKVLVIIDQFEEIFQEHESDKDKRNLEEFVQALNQLISSPDNKISVIATLRADFTGDCSKSVILTHFIQDHAVWIPPLEIDEIKEIIEKPAKEKGYSVQSQLVNLIVKDIQKEENFLPLLQFALHELWNQLDEASKEITLEHCSILRGEENQGLVSILGILNKYADNIYNQCTVTEQIWVKRIFVKLFRTGEKSSRDTRQRLPKQRILDMAGGVKEDQRIIQGVLDKLTKSLLVVGSDKYNGNPWIDLAHEALMDAWERFAEWREEHRSIRRLLDRIEVEYQEYQKDFKYLVGGGLLVQINEYLLDLEPHLDEKIMKFITISNAKNKNILIDNHTLQQKKQKADREIIQLKIELERLQLEVSSQNEMLFFYKAEISEHKERLGSNQDQYNNKYNIQINTDNSSMVQFGIGENKITGKNIGYNSISNIGGVVTNQHNYAPEQDLAEAAEKIQRLLKQLEKSNPNATEIEQVDHVNAATSSDFKEQIVKALKASDTIDYLDFIQSPGIAAIISGWMDKSGED